MRLVKTVARELLYQVEDLHGELRINALFFGPSLKNRALFRHFLGLLLTHGTAQQVCTTQRVTRQLLCDLHDLLLIEDDAVGGLKDGL